jgi:hypothetical protein
MRRNRVRERLLRRRVAHERHVGDEKGAPQSLRDGTAVIDDVFHRHGHRAVVTLDHHAERVTHEHDVHTAAVDQRREARIVRRQTGDLLA